MTKITQREIANAIDQLKDNSERDIVLNNGRISEIVITGGILREVNGTIHISPSWANDGFTVYTFAHEYGHYLQEEMGTIKYYNMAVQSVYSAYFDPANHNKQPFEQEATKLGMDYLNNAHMIK